MSQKLRPLILSSACLLMLACATGAILVSRAGSDSIPTQEPTQTRRTTTSSNLSLQPEAARVNRRLGNRFNSSSKAETNVTAVLKIGSNQNPVTIVRRSEPDGERVDLLLPDKQLTWNSQDGAKAASSVLSVTERLLAERLIFDTADHFVFAQLRGASYYTVARNLRPDDAGDDYKGPVWTVVRLSEPQQTRDAAPMSPWRLYYINTTTELIDRIVCELNGRRIETTIQWVEQNGEQIPSRLKWTTQGETLMEYEVTAFRQTK